MSPGASVSKTVALETRGFNGLNVEWWVAASTDFGWFSYIYPSGWTAGVKRCALAPLFRLSSPFEILNTALPAGHYTFYFAVENNLDGLPQATWWDFVSVEVRQE